MWADKVGVINQELMRVLGEGLGFRIMEKSKLSFSMELEGTQRA